MKKESNHDNFKVGILQRLNSFDLYLSSKSCQETISTSFELCQYAQQVQRSKREIVKNQENELVRLNDLAAKLEKMLMENLKCKSHLG